MVNTLTDTGNINAAPTPWSARNATIMPTVGDRAHPTEAIPNSAIPDSSARRRPKMSPIRPAGTMNAPKVSM